jgi:hypothetical protein
MQLQNEVEQNYGIILEREELRSWAGKLKS